MRVLVIENSAEIQSALEAVLAGFENREKATDRASALDLFENSLAADRLFELVIVDIDTPGMQEGSMIAEIRQIEDKHRIPEEKRACLIVISASPGRQLLTDCMLRGCDEFIDKPVDPDQVLETLTRFNLTTASRRPEPSLLKRTTGKELFDIVIRSFERGELELPPAPKIAMRTRQLVDLNADIDVLIDLLRHDLSTSTRLIRMSNSVAYGGYEKNTSVGQAVRRLGVDRSVEVVMSICCRSYFVTNHPGYKQMVEDLWWHSLACAHLIIMIADQKKIDAEEDLFALGLLHDIGKLILLQAASNLQTSRKTAVDIEPEALQTMLAEYHGQVGNRILKKWGYSKAFSALIQHHRASVEADPPSAMQALHEANLLAATAGFGYGADHASEAADELEKRGYSAQHREALTDQIRTRIKQLRYSFA